MFDIGFQELVLIGLIGLVVVGPARLPKLAKTVGLYVNKMRRFVTDVRSDVERELHAEELRQSFSGNSELNDLKNVVNEARAGLDDVRSTVDETRDELKDATATPPGWANPDVDTEKGAAGEAASASSLPDDRASDAAERDDEDITVLNPNFRRNPSIEPKTAAAQAQTPAADAEVELPPPDDATASSQVDASEPHDVAPAPASTVAGDDTDADATVLNPQLRQAPVPADVSEEDEDAPTILNAALTAKREAGGKPD